MHLQFFSGAVRCAPVAGEDSILMRMIERSFTEDEFEYLQLHPVFQRALENAHDHLDDFEGVRALAVDLVAQRPRPRW